MDVQSFFDCEVIDYRRIDVAGSRTHHQSLERSQSHRSVDRVSASNRSRRAAVAEVKRDQVCLFASQIADLAITICNVAMRCSVKTVATNSITAIILIRDCVEIRAFGKRLMKRGIEHSDLRQPWPEQIFCRVNSFEVS